MSALLNSWRERGEHAELLGHQVFFVDQGPRDAPVLLLMHGFPTCSLDFAGALPTLTKTFRVVAHDHLGFGLSDKPIDYSYSLMEQAEIALALWTELGIARAHLLAHDMGTSIATEILARRERLGIGFELRSLTLCNGSIYIDMASLTTVQQLLLSPTWGPIVARRSSRKFFGKRLRGVVADPTCLSEEELDAQWAAIEFQDGVLRVPEIIKYIHERSRFAARWHGALRGLDVPAHVLWGQKDPVALPTIGDRLAAEIPGATFTPLPALGHFPMVEGPEAWATAAVAFLSGLPADAG